MKTTINVSADRLVEFSYDPRAKACYFGFSEEPVSYTDPTQMKDGRMINADIGASGDVVGVEFIGFSGAHVKSMHKSIRDALIDRNAVKPEEVDCIKRGVAHCV